MTRPWDAALEAEVASALRAAAQAGPAHDDVQERVDAVLARHRRRRNGVALAVAGAVLAAGGLGAVRLADRPSATASAAASTTTATADPTSDPADPTSDPLATSLSDVVTRYPRGAPLQLVPRLEGTRNGLWRAVLPSGKVADLHGSPLMTAFRPDAVQGHDGSALVLVVQHGNGEIGLVRVTPDGRTTWTRLDTTPHDAALSKDARTVALGEVDAAHRPVVRIGSPSSGWTTVRLAARPPGAGWQVDEVQPMVVTSAGAVVMLQLSRPMAPTDQPSPPTGGASASPTDGSDPVQREGTGIVVVVSRAGDVQRQVPGDFAMDVAGSDDVFVFSGGPCPVRASIPLLLRTTPPTPSVCAEQDPTNLPVPGPGGRTAAMRYAQEGAGGGSIPDQVLVVRDRPGGRERELLRLGVDESLVPFWEDAGHVLLLPVGTESHDGLRVRVSDGRVERVPYPEDVTMIVG